MVFFGELTESCSIHFNLRHYVTIYICVIKSEYTMFLCADM